MSCYQKNKKDKKRVIFFSIVHVHVCGCWSIFEYGRGMLSLCVSMSRIVSPGISQSLLHQHFCLPETTQNDSDTFRIREISQNNLTKASYPLLSMISSYPHILFLLNNTYIYIYIHTNIFESSNRQQIQQKYLQRFDFNFLAQDYYYCRIHTVVEYNSSTYSNDPKRNRIKSFFKHCHVRTYTYVRLVAGHKHTTIIRRSLSFTSHGNT